MPLYQVKPKEMDRIEAIHSKEAKRLIDEGSQTWEWWANAYRLGILSFADDAVVLNMTRSYDSFSFDSYLIYHADGTIGHMSATFFEAEYEPVDAPDFVWDGD